MAGKKVQVPVLGGLRKVIQVPTSQNVGTTIQEFGSQVVSLAQLKVALGITSSKGTVVAGGGVAGASLIVGPGMSGGGVLTGAVNIGLLQSVPPVFWNDALLPDDFVGGAVSGGGGGGTASPLTTKGDVYVFGTGNTRLPVGADGQILTSSSSATNGVDWESITNSSLAYVNTTVPAGNTVANTVTATAFASSYTIAAGYLPVGAVIRVVMKGVYSTAALAPTISIALKFGTAVLLTTGAVSPLATSATNDGWSYEALLVVQSTGASGAIESQGTAVFQTATTSAAVLPLENTAPITVDTTIAEAITAVVTWGTASASNTITLREMAVWIEGVAPSSGGTSLPIPATIPDLQYWFQGDIAAGNSTAGNYIPGMSNSNPFSSYGPLPLNKGAKRAASNLNSKAVAVYDGSTTGYLFQQAGLFLGQITVFVVYNPAAAAVGDFVAGTASNALQFRMNASNELEFVCSGIAVIGASTAALTTGSWSQGNATYNSTTGAYAFRVARTASGSGTSVQTISVNSVSVCYNAQGATEFLNGSLAELIVYNRILTGTEISTVESYLNSKWGV
jgi:hypothetical protein